MGDEIRVTVIATAERTGISCRRAARNAVHRLNTRPERERATVGVPAANTSAQAGQQPAGPASSAIPAASHRERDREPQMAEVPPRQYSDDLDLPAFLRRRK
jgi:hypothetical protein